jgi:nucleotide-binding universal stress UspA family protein
VLIVHVSASPEPWDETSVRDLVEPGDPPPLGVVAGATADGLRAAAEEHHASLIVLGRTHRGRASRAVLGTTAERLLRDGRCPVAVASAGYTASRVGAVAVAYDGSTGARAAAAYAGTLAERLGASVHILVAAERAFAALTRAGRERRSPAASGFLEQAREHAREGARAIPEDVLVRTSVLLGDPVEDLCAACADGIDLLVCGSRGVGPVRSVLQDAVSGRLVARAPCPVIVVPRAMDERPPSAAPHRFVPLAEERTCPG